MHARKLPKLLAIVSTLAGLLLAPLPIAADNGTDTTVLRNAVTLAGVRAHQQQLQAIANANGGTRMAGSSGYDQSAAYVASLLSATNYFNVSEQPFQYDFFEELSPPILAQTAPNPATTYEYGVDYQSMEYSASGNVTAEAQAVDLLLPPTGGSTSGCEAADFAGFTGGRIALIQRGTCTFREKALNAQAAGATAVIIFNEGNSPDREPLIGGTLGGSGIGIPVLDTSYAVGAAFNALIGSGLTLHIETDTVIETRTTHNVIAETKVGRTDRVVVVGAHLDSVPEGPGINDNGSGSAVILETALQMARLGIQPRNQVRFMWYSAEEAGLVGSTYYVGQLNKRQIGDIAVMLNFDMVGSPNYVRFVYDGDGSGTGTAGPNGSKVVEDVFNSYFAAQGLAVEPTAFDGRSDYGPFIDAGIPAGGLFTGAEELKTADQAAKYGGTAGVALDPCYHQACDTYANNSDVVLDQMADAVAHAVLTFAMTTSAVNGTDKGKGGGASKFDYQGTLLKR